MTSDLEQAAQPWHDPKKMDAVLLVSVVIAFMLHGAATYMLQWIPQPSELSLLSSEVAFEMIELPPPPEPEVEEPVPESEPEPEPEEPAPEPPPIERPEPVERPTPREVPPPPEEQAPAPEPPPDQPIEIADFSGTTLTAQGGDFQVYAGDGSDREGPIGPAPTRPRTGDPSAMGTATTGGGGEGPRVVAPADLSAQPQPPSGAEAQLRQCLVENFPREARRQGISARVRASMRITATGRVASVRIRSESVEDQGFGDVCRRCLSELPDWSAPRDAQGQAVATNFPGFCDFQIRF